MLIDSNEPRVPDHSPEPVELDWRLWSWVALSVVLFVAAGSVTGPVAPLLALVGFTCALKALETFAGRYGHGLQEWRQ
jgi:hypothetical protein